MGHFTELGLQPGEALPAPLTAAPAPGMVYNSAGLWVYPPGYLLARDPGGAGTPSNTTAETSILNAALTNAFPAFVAAGDMIEVEFDGHSVQGTGAGTLTLNLYCGATKLVGAVSGGSFAAGVTRGFWGLVRVELLSSTTVSASGIVIPRGASGAGFGGLTSGADVNAPGSDGGDAITVTTLPQNLDLKAILGTATVSSVTLRRCSVRYFPKGY